MNLTGIKNAVTSSAGRKVLLGKKHSPTVLFAGGVVGLVGATVLACRATLKVEDILDASDAKEATIRELKVVGYSEKDRKKDLGYLSIQTTVKIGKLYAPAIGLGIVSVAALTGSHVVLHKRNTALMAAYAALDKGFNEYRARVREEFGEDKEREIRMDGKTFELHDTASGKVIESKRSGLDGTRSIYARLWDQDTTTSWQRQPEYNLAFLSAKQNYCNDRLRARGFVLLNDVYDELGLDRTKPGCVVGWMLGNGDNFIDFGIFADSNQDRFIDFMRGEEGGIWLDFNVDGVIYDKI